MPTAYLPPRHEAWKYLSPSRYSPQICYTVDPRDDVRSSYTLELATWIGKRSIECIVAAIGARCRNDSMVTMIQQMAQTLVLVKPLEAHSLHQTKLFCSMFAYSCRHMNSSLPYSASRLLLAFPPIRSRILAAVRTRSISVEIGLMGKRAAAG